MNNDDYLSIAEQPWMQDAMEITAEHLTQIEELQKLAHQDAFNTMRQLLELVEAQQAVAMAVVRPQRVQSDGRKQLPERTMKVLSQVQAEKYRCFCLNRITDANCSAIQFRLIRGKDFSRRCQMVQLKVRGPK